MEAAYTYWEADDGWLVGYLNSYPDQLTQGRDLAELEEMLADVYQIRQEEEKRLAQLGHSHKSAASETGVNAIIVFPPGISRGTSIVRLPSAGISTVWVMVMFLI